MFVGNRNSNRPAARNPTPAVGFISDLRVGGIMPESDAIRQRWLVRTSATPTRISSSRGDKTTQQNHGRACHATTDETKRARWVLEFDVRA